MAFDILGYRDQFKDVYGDTSLEDVALDAYNKGGFSNQYKDPVSWFKDSGIYDIIQDDLKQRKSKSSIETQDSSILRRGVADPLIGLAKGAVVGIPETVTGLLDIPTGGKAGQVVETGLKKVGINGFKGANKSFENLLSPETQEAQRKVAEAKGFIPTITTALSNPSSIIQTVMESLAPTFVGGRAVGMALKVGEKGIAATERLRRGAIAGGLSEGLITTGQNLEQTRQETFDGSLTPEQIGINMLSGAATATIGAVSGKLAAKLGLEDINTLMAGGGFTKSKDKILRRLFTGALQEGVLEELPQSMQEQIAQNLALDKPIFEGVSEAGAMGMLAGMAQSMGATSLGKAREQFLDRRDQVQPDNEPERKNIGADLVGFIHSGLRTGKLGKDDFTSDDAMAIIQRGYSDGVFDDNDIDKLKSVFPQLSDPINDFIAKKTITKVSETISPEVTEPERRVDQIMRKKIDDMTPEERAIALSTDSLTGLHNKRSYEEGERAPVQVSIDVDNLKYVNDNFGHDAGDMMLKKIGEAIDRAGGRDFSYHFHGDEFVMEGASQEELESVITQAKTILSDEGIDLNGNKYVPDFSYGFGSTLSEADQQMMENKRSRRENGLLAQRGQKPLTFNPTDISIPTKGVTNVQQETENQEAAGTSTETITAQKEEKEVVAPVATPSKLDEMINRVSNLQEYLKRKYPGVAINLATEIGKDRNGLNLSTLQIPEDQRNQGLGTKILTDIKNYADQHDLQIESSPRSEFAGFFDKQNDFSVTESGSYRRLPKSLQTKVTEAPTPAKTKVVKPTKTKKSAAAPIVSTETAVTPKHELPAGLKGAKPRYGYGSKKFGLEFEDDIDKAAYITAQTTKSKSDALYLDFVKSATGMSESAIRAHGTQVKNAIKELAKNANDGSVITVPKFQAAKVEKPKVEKPKVETPKVEKPKVEKPKVEKPKVEKPKVEKPKVEKPKVETEPAKTQEPIIDKAKEDRKRLIKERVEAAKKKMTPKQLHGTELEDETLKWLTENDPENTQSYDALDDAVSLDEYENDPYEDVTGRRRELNFDQYAIKAYHGSTQDFDNFKHEFFGSGEGPNSGVYGFYFTSKKDVAKEYTDYIEDVQKNRAKRKGEPEPKIDKTVYEVVIHEGKKSSEYDYIDRGRFISDNQRQKVLKGIENSSPEIKEKFQKSQNFMDDLNKSIRGYSLYSNIWRVLGSDKAASQWLSSIGIDGMTVKEQGHSVRIVFNPDEITIKEKKKAPNFISGSSSKDHLSLENVQQIFKGQEVIQPGGPNSPIYVRTNGGKYLTIENVNHISATDVDFEIAYGEKFDENEMQITGVYNAGTIRLTRNAASQWTLSHESMHFIEDVGILTDHEINLLKNHITNLVRDGKFKTANSKDVGGFEDRANFLADHMTKEKSQGLLGRMIDKVKDFIDKIYKAFGQSTIHSIQKGIETGEIYNREVAGFTGSESAELYTLREKIKPFFSQLDRVVNKKMGGKMPVDQLRKMLKGNGVTDAEIENLIGRLSGTVTKQQVVDEIKANTTEYKDHVLSTPSITYDQLPPEAQEIHDKWMNNEYSSWTEYEAALQSLGYKTAGGDDNLEEPVFSRSDDDLVAEESAKAYDYLMDSDDESIREDAHSFYNNGDDISMIEMAEEYGYEPSAAYTAYVNDENKTQFSHYVEPGGTNYQEFFVTAPSKDKKGSISTEDLQTYSPEAYETLVEFKLAPIFDNNTKTITYRDMSSISNSYSYKSLNQLDGLFPIQVRVAAGILEDAITEYTRNSWNDGHNAYSDISNPIVRIRMNDRTIDGKSILFIEEMQGPSDENQGRMPDYLKKRIYDIGVKRMIAYAKANGYDGIAWTTGQMQADRYDLSKQIDRINWDKNDDGTYELGIVDKKGRQTIWQDGSTKAKDLESIFGKEISNKILSSSESGGVLEGLDLQIGGEGLKALYDRILPNLFKRYGKANIDKLSLTTPGQLKKIYVEDLERSAELTDLLNREPEGLSMEDGDRLADLEHEVETMDLGPDETTYRFLSYERSNQVEPDKTFNIQYIPITDKTPSSFPQYAVQRKGKPNQWTIDGPSRLDKFVRVFTDRFVDLKKVVGAINEVSGQLADAKDPALQQILYSAKVKNGIDDFMRDELRPFLRDISKLNVTIDGLHEYILNRHAPEANAYIASINPKLQDGGSGVLTKDAQDYMKNLDPVTKLKYESLARTYDSMAQKNLQILVDNGLESQKTVNTWMAKYQHYAPLYRSDMEKNGGFGTGRGFTVVGSSSKARHGSTRDVSNVIASLAEQRERYLTRVYKNNVDKAIVALAYQFPNSDFWSLAKPTVVDRISADPANKGKMVKVVDLSYMNDDNIIMARIPDPKTGEIIQQGVEFNVDNERARETVKALKNLDLDKLGIVLNYSAKVTRFISSVNTQYNPVFGLVNFVRDFQTAVLNLSTTPIAGKQTELIKGIFPALQTIYKDIRAERQGFKRNTNSQIERDWQDFRAHGGLVGYRDLYNTKEDRVKAMQSEMDKLSHGFSRKLGFMIADWVSDYNTTIESAVRLSAYSLGVKNGMSKDRAAAMAKNLTLDFNKKGQISMQAGALYAFFNASAQGVARIAETLAGPAGRKIMVGGIMVGILQAMMLGAAGLREDEPPEFVKERNLVIPTGSKSYITIPMPLGFHVLPNIGRIVAEYAMSGFKQPMKRFTDLFGMIVEATNPMGSSGWGLQTLAPTPVDPLVALAENKDWTGRTIYKENHDPLQPTPGFTRAKDSATGFSSGLAWAINKVSGGTEANPGLFSPTPDQIDYLGGQLGGGVVREANKTIQATMNLGSPDKLPAHKIPVLSRFYGETEGGNQVSTRFFENIKRLNEHELEIKQLQKERKPLREYFTENPEARLVNMANSIDNNIDKLRSQKKLLKDRGADDLAIKRIDDLISIQMKRLNEAVDKTVNAHK